MKFESSSYFIIEVKITMKWNIISTPSFGSETGILGDANIYSDRFAVF